MIFERLIDLEIDFSKIVRLAVSSSLGLRSIQYEQVRTYPSHRAIWNLLVPTFA